MDFSIIQSILEWLAPAGWLATSLAWWRDRKVFKVRAVKEEESTYHQLYNDLSETVKELSEQLKKTNGKIIILESALRHCHQCRYADKCPVLQWMQGKQGKLNSRPLGQHAVQRNRGEHYRAGPDESDGPGSDTGSSDTIDPVAEGIFFGSSLG